MIHTSLLNSKKKEKERKYLKIELLKKYKVVSLGIPLFSARFFVRL